MILMQLELDDAQIECVYSLTLWILIGLSIMESRISVVPKILNSYMSALNMNESAFPISSETPYQIAILRDVFCHIGIFYM